MDLDVVNDARGLPGPSGPNAHGAEARGRAISPTAVPSQGLRGGIAEKTDEARARSRGAGRDVAGAEL
eukprot:3392836-Pyramimonas_sp.AAC.1